MRICQIEEQEKGAKNSLTWRTSSFCSRAGQLRGTHLGLAISICTIVISTVEGVLYVQLQ